MGEGFNGCGGDIIAMLIAISADFGWFAFKSEEFGPCPGDADVGPAVPAIVVAQHGEFVCPHVSQFFPVPSGRLRLLRSCESGPNRAARGT